MFANQKEKGLSFGLIFNSTNRSKSMRVSLRKVKKIEKTPLNIQKLARLH